MGEYKDKNIYCPFHGESRRKGSKPSARFYDNIIPVKLWCFQEHRSYYAYHYIKLILKGDPLQYLINHSSSKQIEYYANEYKEEQKDEYPKLDISSLKELDEMYDTLDIRKDYSKWYIV